MKFQEEMKKFIESNPGYRILYMTKYGSHLFGTNSENSDEDYKGIFVAPMEDIILKKDISSWAIDKSKSDLVRKNNKDDIDFNLMSVQDFFADLKTGEVNSLSILFSMFRKDTIMIEDIDFTSFIKENYEHLITDNLVRFSDYSISQSYKYGLKGAKLKEIILFKDFLKNIPLNDKVSKYEESIKTFLNENNFTYITHHIGEERTNSKVVDWHFVVIDEVKIQINLKMSFLIEALDKKISNYGKRVKKVEDGNDWKALSHSIRILDEAIEFCNHNKITYPLENRFFIRDVKLGLVDFEIVKQVICDKMDELEVLDNKMIHLSQDEKLVTEYILKLIMGDSYVKNRK